MLDIRQELAPRHAIAAQFVGDEDARHILQTLQQPLEEVLRRPAIATALYQDVEHDPALIHGSPEIV